MATRGQSVWLPKAQVLVCTKPGQELTDVEVAALEEFVVLIYENRHLRHVCGVTGYTTEDNCPACRKDREAKDAAATPSRNQY